MSIITLFLLAVIGLTQAQAEVPAEPVALHHISAQIAALTLLLDQAEIHAAKQARTTRYACLRGDLAQVHDGIESHLDNARLQPAEASALCLDYLAHSALPGVRLAAAEREALARLAHALAALDSLITAAESTAAENTRIVFQYPWLRQDLHDIRSALVRLVTAPTTVPRAFAPLAGDHRR